MLTSLRVETLPRKLGRYVLEELLATGGMAEIYRALLPAPVEEASKILVIKRVLPHLARNREFIDLFLDEARISVPLSHGNIVQMFELGEEDGDYFLAMEYVRGRDLDSALQRLRAKGEVMPLALALHIAAGVADGLDYAHTFRDAADRPAGIVHRDVSPHNILLGYQGEVKITDFGIAKARSRLHQTSQGIIRGKACYLSPEQAESRPLDGRSDQFSLGAVLWELLTGRRAFEGDSEVASLERVRAAEAPPPSRLRPELPPAVDGIVARALARAPEERFPSCRALAVELRRVQAQVEAAAPSQGLGDFLRGLFAAEITREIRTRGAREQLLERLAPAQRLAATSLSTDEILRMGTVDMQAPVAREVPPPRKLGHRLLPAVGVFGGLLALLALALRWIGWPPPTDLTQDAGAPLAQDAGAPLAEDAGAPLAEDAGAPDAGPAERTDAAAPTPGDPAPSPADAGAAIEEPPGFLNLNASPWAFVELDGQRLPGETPLFRVRVAPGPHRLRFFNPKLRIERTQAITVRSGQTQTVSVELLGP
ncbi:MAG TPA: protein kinase [Myxococcota bacterium]|nr:protein kinase [Myxococcota bacterium]HRY94218.1 protein kinase [Myxococcota bacterium]HSA23622.1 protein kinase [Myxococcota bacterium]